jgi:hypothetical protein
MSGLQGGRCHFDKTLTFLMNFERPTECRYDMRHVVAYVVAYVVLVRVLPERVRIRGARAGTGV